MEQLRLHTEEVRAQVALNWDRAKTSVPLHVALLVGTGCLRDRLGPLSVALFLFTGVSAVLGAWMLGIGHGYYRAARDRRAQIEEELGLAIRFGTTKTQRGEPQPGLQRYWPKVNTITIALHILIAAMAITAAVAHASAR